MNVMGRILVVLNLLFALVTGGFLVVDFATRNNWKQAFEELKRETEVSRSNTTAMAQTNRELFAKLEEAKTKAVDAQEAVVKQKSDYEKIIADLRVKVNGEENIAQELKSEKYLSEMEKLQKESKALQDVIAQREQRIIDLQKQKDDYFRDAQQAVNERDAALARAGELLKRLRVLEVNRANAEVAALNSQSGKSEGIIGAKISLRDPSKPNPPPTYVKGVVEKVDGTDGSLVQLSLGSDAGVQTGHTLEVFRLQPRAEYIGLVRILEVEPHKAVGRVYRSRYGASTPVRPGDSVASSLRAGN